MANDPREELCPDFHIVRVTACSECISCQPEPTQLHGSASLTVKNDYYGPEVIKIRAAFWFPSPTCLGKRHPHNEA